MIELTQKTILLINKLFQENERDEVIEILKYECAENLLLHKEIIDSGNERIRFAAIKLSDGDLKKFYYAVDLAQKDWRDLLVFADFANDINAHVIWSNKLL